MKPLRRLMGQLDVVNEGDAGQGGIQNWHK